MHVEIVKAYFSYLCTEKEPIITTVWMLEEKKGIVPGYGCVHSKVSDLADIWKQVSRQNCTCHTTLNRTNLKGRKSEHIELARVFCVDLDRQVTEDELDAIKEKYRPGLIVESSPRRFHIYWRSPQTVRLDLWSKIQIGLAYELKGDYNLAHKTHIIRVPGFKRITKDGKPFTCRIVHQDIKPQIADIKSWDWLDNAIEEGEAEKNYQIAEMVKIAKNCMKAKGTLHKIPEQIAVGQRNVTLYSAVRGFVIENCSELESSDKLPKDLEKEAVSWGLTLNERFTPPLPQLEAVTAIRSGIQHGLKAVQKQQKRREELKRYLRQTAEGQYAETTGQTAESAQSGQIEQGRQTMQTAEGQEVLTNEPRLAVVQPEEIEPLDHVEVEEKLIAPKTGNGNGHKVEVCSVNIPVSPDGAASRLVELISTTDLTGAVTRLAAAVEFRTYNEYVKYLLDKFKLVGAYRKDGPCLFLREKTRWGTEVKYPVGLTSDQADWFISKVVSELGLAGLGVAETADKLRKPIHTSTALNIAKLWYKAAASQPSRERQPGNIVVFQNGVLELGEDGDNFKEDTLAPLKYSHPIACYYNREVAASFRESIEKDYPIMRLVHDSCPVFWKFCQDWFPRDIGVVKVLLNWFGYSFTTSIARQKFMFFYGPTRSGKGSLCRTLCAMAGWNNYSSSDYAALDGGFRRYNMFDKLVISIEETEGTAIQHEQRISYLKKLIGGERTTFERKYHQPFEDKVIGKFVMQSNKVPQYQDEGHAVKARMIVIGFEHSFEDCDIVVDPSQAILEAEADKLATIAALYWSINYENEDCFRNSESRAMQLGLNTVIADLDIVGDSVKKYLVWDSNSRVSSQALSELVTFIAKERDLVLQGKLSHNISREIKVRFPQVGTGLIKNKRRSFIGVKFAKKEILEQYPELRTAESQSNPDILVLLEELELLNYKTDVII